MDDVHLSVHVTRFPLNSMKKILAEAIVVSEADTLHLTSEIVFLWTYA